MSHPLLPAVIELVGLAGQAILPFWRADVAVVEKADASPVTAADLAAHRILADGLAALDAGIPVLSEEAADIPSPSAPPGSAGGWSTRWMAPRNSSPAPMSSPSTSR